MIDNWSILHCLQALVEAIRLLSASHCARMSRAPSARERRSHAEVENCVRAACKRGCINESLRITYNCQVRKFLTTSL